MVLEDLSQGIKRKTDCSPSSSAGDKKEWRYVSTAQHDFRVSKGTLPFYLQAMPV